MKNWEKNMCANMNCWEESHVSKLSVMQASQPAGRLEPIELLLNLVLGPRHCHLRALSETFHPLQSHGPDGLSLLPWG